MCLFVFAWPGLNPAVRSAAHHADRAAATATLLYTLATAGGADAAPRALVLAAAAVFVANRARTVPPASEASVLYTHALFRALAFWACALHADAAWFSRHGCVVGLSLGYALHVCVVWNMGGFE